MGVWFLLGLVGALVAGLALLVLGVLAFAGLLRDAAARREWAEGRAPRDERAAAAALWPECGRRSRRLPASSSWRGAV